MNPEKATATATGLRWIVLLHGMMGKVTNWRATLDHFAGRYRMLPVEFPLYDHRAPHHNVHTLTRIVRERMDDRGIGEAVLFGNSMGGQIALNLALEAPDRVAALVLTGSAGLFERSMVDGQTPMNPSREWISNRVREVFYDPAHATDDIVDEVLTILSTNRNKLRLIKLARALRKHHMGDLLPRIQVPTLLVWGRQDSITPVDTARLFADSLPDAQLHMLDQCGHAPNIEQPGQFNQLAEGFLKEIGYR